MDDTSIDELLTDLESADPAEAPDLADAITNELAEELESENGDTPETAS